MGRPRGRKRDNVIKHLSNVQDHFLFLVNLQDFFTDAEHIHMSQLLTAAAGEFGEPSKIKFILPAVNEGEPL